MTDEIFQERQLKDYVLEQMTPQERQEIWEQQQLNELHGNPAPQPYGLPLDDLQQYILFLSNQLWHDQRDQTMRIYEMHNNDYIEEYKRNDELLTQKEEWEDIAYRLQQIQ